MACKWIFRDGKIKNTKSLMKLLEFYLWRTPVSGVSQKGRPFSSYGWRSSKFSMLHARMRKVSGFPDTKEDRWVAASGKDIESKLAALDRLDYYDCSFEFAVHMVKNGLNKTEALFYLIRNSFAHGGFRVSEHSGERYYVFENRHDSKLKGRAIFRESTLLEWIQIVEAGPDSDGRR